MRVARGSLLFLVTLVVVAIYVANLADLLSAKRDGLSSANSTSAKFENREFKRLMWFVQVSDLHISMFSDSSRIDDLKEFCEITVKTIRPHVVLATGDLTDGKMAEGFGSKEMKEEWASYSRVLNETDVLRHTTWLDTRGNHDNFDVPSLDSESNYFRSIWRYSAQGGNHPRSYARRLEVDGESYWFVAVDACPSPGARWPFNFLGILTESDMNRLSAFETAARNGTATFWFGHYPTSCILSASPGLRHLVRNGVAYLCGHLHTFGGLARRMYALQKAGNLELELADWKDRRTYRVGAVDHGLFSFADVPFRRWPVLLVTNPKDSLFALPAKEPLPLVAVSTHVRVLAFSPHTVRQVSFKVDDGDWRTCERAGGPLFVAPWDPSSYATGLHAITVRAEDGAGNEETVSHQFALDGSQTHFGLLPRILLMSNLSMIVQVVFGSSVVLAAAPLCAVRAVASLRKAGRYRVPERRGSFGRWVLRRLWLVSTLDKFYYPMVLMTLYVPFGPWLVGHLLEGHVGVIFSWGMYVKGTFLPGGMTFVFGTLHVWTFNVTLLLALSHCADSRFRRLTTARAQTVLGHAWSHVPMAAVTSLNAYVAYLVYLTYGPLAFFASPLRTWGSLWAVYAWYLAATLTNRAVLPAKSVFCPGPGPGREDRDRLVPLKRIASTHES